MRSPKGRRRGSRTRGGRVLVLSRRWVWARTQLALGWRRATKPANASATEPAWARQSARTRASSSQGGALGHVGRHGVGGVADQGHRSPAPAFGGHLLDRGGMDRGLVVGLVQQLWDGGGEAGEALAQPGQRVAGGWGGAVGRLVVMSA